MPDSQKTPIQETLEQMDANLNDYAIKRQALRFQEIHNNFDRDVKRLQQKLGKAYGNAEAIAAINKEYEALVAQKNADLAAAEDIEQFKEGFNNNKYVKNRDKQIANNKADAKAAEAAEAIKDGALKDTSKSSLTGSIDSISSDISDGLSGYLQAKAFGATEQSPNSEYIRNQARMHDIQAADEQKNAARNNQIANRNYKTEAEKEAASSAAAQNAQKVNNMGNVSAGAAALERGVQTADYGTHMQRQDTQRQEGVKNQREMWGARQTAEEERSDAVTDDNDYREHNLYNSLSNYLSKGGFGGEQKQDPNPQKPEDKPPQPQPQQETTAPSTTGAGTLQNIINYAFGRETRRTHSDSGAAKIWYVTNNNGAINIVPAPDNKQTEMNGETVFPEYTQAMEQEVINTYNSNEKYHRKQGESEAAYTKRMEGERGGLNQGDPKWELEAAKTIQEQPQQPQATTSDLRQKNIIAAVSSRF